MTAGGTDLAGLWSREWDIYILAGVATVPGFFDPLEKGLLARYAASGRRPAVRCLYPYGDYRVSVLRQLRQVGGDMSARRRAWRRGGQEAAASIRALTPGRPVLLIGHSGGGAAAYQAARLLAQEGVLPDYRIVEIGAPRHRIAPDTADRVSYFAAVDEAGRPSDPVTRLGSWGGFARTRYGAVRWDRFRYAPGHIGTIPIVGGHPDYFRDKEPYTNQEGVSNLTQTLNAIWGRLEE